jgi:hypothetical protein
MRSPVMRDGDRPQEGGAPWRGRRGPELDLVERIPAYDAVDHDAWRAGTALVRHRDARPYVPPPASSGIMPLMACAMQPAQ